MSESEPLVVDYRASVVVATSIDEGVEMTVHALLESENEADIEKGAIFMRRVFALLVLQYLCILLVAFPFTLIQSFKAAVDPYHGILEVIAISGIISSLCLLAIFKGSVYPYSRVALVFFTLSVALEVGLSFAGASWGTYGLIALGQATTSFAVVLAIFQFEVRSLEWFDYNAAALVCFVLSGLWTVVLTEAGLSLLIATVVGFGGWAFTMINILACRMITKHCVADEFIMATLFILVPEALFFASNHHPKKTAEPAPQLLDMVERESIVV